MKPRPELYHQNKPGENKLVQWSWTSKDPRSPVYWAETEEHNSKWWDFWDSGYSPYGVPGDRLWVRETWNRAERTGYDAAPQDRRPGFDESDPDAYNFGPCWYRATDDGRVEGAWRPSIHMPRWASRITLEIASVRVERLQDITFLDALAEGVKGPFTPGIDVDIDGNFYASGQAKAVSLYRALWESINSPGSWDANPWVWVVEFKKVEAAS
jgi:hypothetical protein